MNRKRIAFSAVSIGLLVLFSVGVMLLTDYQTRPGSDGDVGKRIERVKLSMIDDRRVEQPLILVFYHPHCPCTQATVRDLERLAPRFSSSPRIVALAYQPAEEETAWLNSATTRMLDSLPDSQIVADPEGARAREFGVEVSGHILVYSPADELLFSGGITPYRGHEGDCASSTEFMRCVNQGGGGLSQTPVFGCAIY